MPQFELESMFCIGKVITIKKSFMNPPNHTIRKYWGLYSDLHLQERVPSGSGGV